MSCKEGFQFGCTWAVAIMLCIFTFTGFFGCEADNGNEQDSCLSEAECEEGELCSSDGSCLPAGDGDAEVDDITADGDVDLDVEQDFTDVEERVEDGDIDALESDKDPEVEAEAELEAEEEEAPEDYEYAIKTINYAMDKILTVLPAFAERGLILYLNVQPTHIGDEDFAEVLKQAKALNVRVKLWPLLKPDDGAWCNEDNIHPFWANVFAVLDYLETIEHNVEIVVINSELGPPKIDLIRQYYAEGKLAELIELVKGNIDKEMFSQSTLSIQQGVAELKLRGYKAQVTTYPYLLDDLEDGDPDIQDAANVVLEGVDWDRAAFTPYTGAYSVDFDKNFGPYFVYSYAMMARKHFGRKADIAIGMVSPGNPSSYDSPAELAADVAAAKAAGVRRIDVFDLKGMLVDDRFGEWADALLAEPQIPPDDGITDLFHEDFKLIDMMLDSLGTED